MLINCIYTLIVKWYRYTGIRLWSWNILIYCIKLCTDIIEYRKYFPSMWYQRSHALANCYYYYAPPYNGKGALSVCFVRPSVIPSHQSLTSQLLHPCMDLNETWYRCWTTSLEVHVGIWFMFGKFWQSYGPWHLEFFSHFSLSSQLLLHPCMDLNETWQGCCTTSLEVHVGR